MKREKTSCFSCRPASGLPDKLLFGGPTVAPTLAPRIYEGGAPVRTLGRGESVENWKPGTFTFGWFRSKAGCLRRPFSCPAKKMDKNAAKGGVEAACSRRRATPLWNPPGALSRQWVKCFGF